MKYRAKNSLKYYILNSYDHVFKAILLLYFFFKFFYALLEEITLREDLNTHQLNVINSEICRQHTDLMQLENIGACHPFDLTKDVDEAKDRIKSNVLELKKEKRQASVDCWQDLMFLNDSDPGLGKCVPRGYRLS